MASFALKQSSVRACLSATLKLVSLLAFLLAVGVHADVMRCSDANGKTIYTDNRALCRNDETKSLNLCTRGEVSPVNKGKVDYRIPERQYESVGSNYTVLIEHDLLEGDTTHAKVGINTDGNIFRVAASVCIKASPIDVLFNGGRKTHRKVTEKAVCPYSTR